MCWNPKSTHRFWLLSPKSGWRGGTRGSKRTKGLPQLQGEHGTCDRPLFLTHCSQLPSLALFVHGKKEGTDRLVDSFIETLVSTESVVPPKAQIKKRILDLAERRKGGGVSTSHPDEEKEAGNVFGSARWVVHGEVAAKLGLEGQLPVIEYTPQKPKSTKRLAKHSKAPIAPVAVEAASAEKNAPLFSDLPESAQVSLLQFFQGGREHAEPQEKQAEAECSAAPVLSPE